jgi:hypothetical protein
MNRSCSLALALFAVSCSSTRTEVLVVVDTDMDVPAELDEVRIDLIGPGGETRRAEGSVASVDDLPRTLGIVDSTQSMRSVRVTVTGLRGGANVVQRRASFTFVPNETRILRMDLLRGCLGVGCASDETCGDNGCRSIEIAPQELLPYDESLLGRRDAGTSDGSVLTDGGCVVVKEICNEADDDCDGAADEDFDLQTDMLNCGGCGTACPASPDHASSVCEAGECVLRCDRDFDDCDTRIETGCEASLAEAAHCGSCENSCTGPEPFCMDMEGGLDCSANCGTDTVCGTTCANLDSDPLHCGSCEMECPSPPNARATCIARTCDFACDDGYQNCDGNPANGCESNLRELDHCGMCGQSCRRDHAVTSCATGTCELLGCDPLFGDCDGSLVNGCEEDLSTNILRCGDCNIACPTGVMHGAVDCAAGSCRIACDPGFGNCDSMLATGCEQNISEPGSCGACGVACSDPEPLCASLPGGGYACTAGCTGSMLCGASCVDTMSDPQHCNGCDMPCPTGENASPQCQAGTCSLGCNAGFDDCDSSAGCETPVAVDPAHCGDCSTVCPAVPNAMPTCAAGDCGYRCEPGFDDCTGGPNGCETNITSDTSHCGGCGDRCMSGGPVMSFACMDSVCVITGCPAGRENCDGNFANGCEVRTSSDKDNCGGCGNDCGPGYRCCDGTCTRGMC